MLKEISVYKAFGFVSFYSNLPSKKEEKLYTDLETSCMAYLTRFTNGRHTSKTKRCFTVTSVLNPKAHTN